MSQISPPSPSGEPTPLVETIDHVVEKITQVRPPNRTTLVDLLTQALVDRLTQPWSMKPPSPGRKFRPH
jgi:hypothetical protein